MHIKVNDTVQIMTGDDKGVQGKVLSVDHQSRKVLVEGVNLVYKHVRRSQRNPQGGRLSKEMPVQASNVLWCCPSCSKPSRTGSRYGDEVSKERYCKRCGKSAGVVAPARSSYAKK